METKHDDEGCFFSLFSQKNKASLPAFGLVMFEAKGKLYCFNQKLYSCLMLVSHILSELHLVFGIDHFCEIQFSIWVRLFLFLLFFLWNFFPIVRSVSESRIDVQIYSLWAVFFVIAIITCGARRAVIAFFPVVCLIFSVFSNWLWCQLHVCSAPLCQSVSIYFIFIFLFLWMFTFFWLPWRRSLCLCWWTPADCRCWLWHLEWTFCNTIPWNRVTSMSSLHNVKTI